jgi:hypothetical protein
VDALQIARAIGPRSEEPDASGEIPAQTAEFGFESFVQDERGDHQDELAFAVGHEVGGGEVALALGRAALAQR